MKVLIEKYINRKISHEEKEELWDWVNQSEDNLNYFKDYLAKNDITTLQKFDSELAYNKFIDTITAQRKKKKYFSNLYKYAAILVLCLAIGYLAREHFFNTDQNTEFITATELQDGVKIKLADGTVKVVGVATNESITNTNGNIIAAKNGNSIDFSLNEASEKAKPVYTEISIPNGKTFKIKLSDGTLVWLNSGSTLRFPQHFLEASEQRVVYLEGEAFFDVTKNKKQPFIVNTGELHVKVIGTQFNVSGYKTDMAIKTTLVEGSVLVYEKNEPETELLLAPSYQASFNKENKAITKEKVDTSLYTGWMHDKLIMDDLTFSEILIRLERSHNVIFINKAKELNTEKFNGEFSKEQPIEDILKTISLSTFFTYDIDQNKITILK